MDANFWIFDWLEDMSIETEADLRIALGKPDLLEGLRAKARANEPTCRAPILAKGIRVMAGRAIDLSGELDCWEWSCRIR